MKLASEEFMIPAADPGFELYLRNKRPEDMTAFRPEKVVLYVHGATYPAETAFDLALDGVSWMEYIAHRGYDVYMVNMRGFGRSTRPPEMEQPPQANPPLVRTETAAADLGAAVEFICRRRGVERLNLLAWSWGTRIAALYTSRNNGKVNRLVLYAPGWLRTTPSLTDPGGALGAYRTVTVEAARKRKAFGVPPEKQQELMPESWFQAWADVTFSSDPWGARQTPPVIRAPNGSVLDNREFYSAGKAQYDPADIRVPTLLILAEWDQDTPPYMAQALFPLLVNSPGKRLILIGEGTHSLLLEKNRMQLLREVQLFLDSG
ncbi:MAG TPA: alpha/beta fold hydrolase [Burkholderiales bacterium]|nr:alpha/beta fold hydrolase [Burkholderiales bacterium]